MHYIHTNISHCFLFIIDAILLLFIVILILSTRVFHFTNLFSLAVRFFFYLITCCVFFILLYWNVHSSKKSDGHHTAAVSVDWKNWNRALIRPLKNWSVIATFSVVFFFCEKHVSPQMVFVAIENHFVAGLPLQLYKSVALKVVFFIPSSFLILLQAKKNL